MKYTVFQEKKRNSDWEEMEAKLRELVFEHYRLLGRVVYEPLLKELDQEIPEYIAQWN